MTRFAPAAAIVLAAAAASAQPGDDLKAAAGKWTVTRATFAGADVTAVVKSVELRLAPDGGYTFTIDGQTDRGTVKVDPARSPKHLDVVGKEGRNAGKAIKAIYKLDGDTKTVCYELGDGPRPTAFESKAGSTVLLAEYKRTK
jgi:uncharacterized protein (TIGR03067 family)